MYFRWNLPWKFLWSSTGKVFCINSSRNVGRPLQTPFQWRETIVWIQQRPVEMKERRGLRKRQERPQSRPQHLSQKVVNSRTTVRPSEYLHEIGGFHKYSESCVLRVIHV